MFDKSGISKIISIFNIKSKGKNTAIMNTNKDIIILKKYIYETISSSLEPLTFGTLYKLSSKHFKIEKKCFKNAVNELVTEGEIIYSYKYGCSFLEKSFEKPVQISKRIVIVPYQINYSNKSDEIVIKMQSGISFGRGDHPTTRLALRGIEYAYKLNSFSNKPNTASTALDIGTGSGILAIACVLHGAKNALGIDTDLCAVKEAKENVTINGVEKSIKISDTPIEKINGYFSIITANLRYPTLMKLYPVICKLTPTNSVLVFSGIKANECDGLCRLYTEKHFKYCYKETEKGWSSLIFKRC